MSAITITHVPVPARAADHTPVFSNVLRSEWTKLRSVRSTYWTLLAAVIATVGISALISSIYASQYSTMSASSRAHFDPTSFSLNGIFLAQLAIGVLGVLVITSEYSTGAIRSTFAAVPQRRTVLAAKATVFTAVTLVVGVVSSFAAFFIGQAILSTQGIQAHIGDPGVLRAVAGGGIYLAVLGLFALALGTLIRHTAGAISAVFGIVLVLPILVSTLPASWSNSIAKYLPSNAGQAIGRTVQGAGRGGPSLSPWVGMGVFCLYAAVTLAIAAVALRRRDA
ncbi:MAG TPA: ABC transporter permease [Acidimicrobiales bacterium]|jgi:ABC-2 type transport system permease protein|nr:ABC transporter permease [Acidimicrobiales bacterium]